MDMLRTVNRLWQHARWADTELIRALGRAGRATPAEALAELAHIVGTEELWLARLEERAPLAEVWPDVSIVGVEALLKETNVRYREYLATLTPDALDTRIAYTNSAGQEFENAVGDILVHVALHGQYHRGKVNLLLRSAELAPAPTDFIAWVRGAPAATRKTEGQG